MGSNGSVPEPGAPVNPRVAYLQNVSKQEERNLRLDAPVLLDVEHGSVQYRYKPFMDKNLNHEDANRREVAFDGETGNTNDYFYHGRLQDFSARSEEAAHKVCYVTKNPPRSRSQKVHYIYGCGMDSRDGTKSKPTNSIETRPSYPRVQKMLQASNNRYDMSFMELDQTVTEYTEQMETENMSSTPDRSKIQLTLTRNHTAESVRQMLASKLLRNINVIHVWFNGTELRPHDVICELNSEHWNLPADVNVFTVVLRLMAL